MVIDKVKKTRTKKTKSLTEEQKAKLAKETEEAEVIRIAEEALAKVSIKDRVLELDTILIYKYKKYREAVSRLDACRGIILTENTVQQINVVIKEVHELFAELYQIYYFIGHKYADAVRATSDHQAIVDELRNNNDVNNVGDTARA